MAMPASLKRSDDGSTPSPTSMELDFSKFFEQIEEDIKRQNELMSKRMAEVRKLEEVQFRSEDEKEFWKECFFAFVKNPHDWEDTDGVKFADEFLLEYRKRLTEKSKSPYR